MAWTRKSTLSALLIGAGCLAIQGCQQTSKMSPINKSATNSKEIQRLEYRIKKLEKKLEKKLAPSAIRDFKTPTGPIKSLTFRLGTKDDRLRIYWEDGRKSDLPCFKEQAIWACG